MIGDDGTEVATSDLFFGLAAILIVTLCLLSQSLRETVARDDTAPALDRAAASDAGWTAIATDEGVTLHRPGAAAQTLPLDAIMSPATEDWAKAATGPLRLVITAQASDSAFLLETVLARAGVQDMERIRLPSRCASPRFTSRGLLCDGR